MQHWIVDRGSEPLSNWIAAFPGAVLLNRREADNISSSERGIIWFRLRSGESLDAKLTSLRLGAEQSIVVLADEPDESLIAEALSFGASGCCNTNAAPEVLAQVALVIQNGGLWVGQSLLRRLLGSTERALKATPREPRINWASLLSEREVEVARLVAGGASNKEIAALLSITERTVKAHLSAVFEKLNLRDRLQLSLRVNGVDI